MPTMRKVAEICNWVHSFIEQVFNVHPLTTPHCARHQPHRRRPEGWVPASHFLSWGCPFDCVLSGTKRVGEWLEGARACFAKGCREEQDLAGKPGLWGIGPVRNSLVGVSDVLAPQDMLPVLGTNTVLEGRVRKGNG